MCFGGSPGPSTGSIMNQINKQYEGADARQQGAYNAALPFLTQTLQQGTGYFPQIMDYSGGATAEAFAPAQGALSRSQAQAGIDPNSPEGISQQTALNADKARAFQSNMLQNLWQQFQAKMGAGSSLANIAAAQDPLRMLDAMLQYKLQA